ncbi:MAG: hypothetical protein ACLFNV_13435 [Desulfovibrionales bacterium]
MDRIDEGLEPACVTSCTTRCLHFGKNDDVVPLKRLRTARDMSQHPEKRYCR